MLNKEWPRIRLIGKGFVLVLASMAVCSSAQVYPRDHINGSLTYVGQVPVLKLWGTPREQGYAYGFLAGRKILAIFNGFLAENELGIDQAFFESSLAPQIRRMKIEPIYDEELQAMFEGIKASARGKMHIPALKRDLKASDLVVMNCLNDLVRMGCSSVSTWGKMTTDGSPLIGRNNDWHRIPAMIENQLVVARIPPRESGRHAFASVSWAGIIGCITGMNDKGIVLTSHDASGLAPFVRTGFHPYMLTFRSVIESTSPGTAIQDVENALRSRVTGIGKNLMITIPSGTDGPASVVFEVDGDLSQGHGFTKRLPREAESFLVSTNHFRLRMEPSGTCERYALLQDRLGRIRRDPGETRVSAALTWDLLRRVVIPGWRTHHSVVFEPDKKLMHVALAEAGTDAPFRPPVTIDVSSLLKAEDPRR